MENVFILAGKRIPMLFNGELEDQQCNNLLTVTFGKALRSIFDYYSNKADIRRTIAISNKLTRRGNN